MTNSSQNHREINVENSLDLICIKEVEWMKNTKKYLITRIKSQNVNEVEDSVIVEYPLTIYIDQEEFITLLCSPKSLKCLAVGFLYSEGIIESKDDIEDVVVYEEKNIACVHLKNKRKLLEKQNKKRTVTSGCGKGSTFNDVLGSIKKITEPITLKKEEVFSLSNEFGKKSDLFLTTGGVHSCAICKNDEIIMFEEDIARHNALDKILGRAFLEGINLDDKIILTSGRISSEILIKIAKREIPVIISRSAPTDLAVEMAGRLNILLIGFARGERMNLYSNFDKVK